MKFRYSFLLLLAVFVIISCSNGSDDSSGDEANLFECPATVLSSIDNSFSVSTSSRNARSLLGDVVDSETLDASDSSNLYGIINSETEPRRLSGEVSTSTAILSIMKNDAASKMANYGFGRKYATSFQSKQFIEKSYMNITVSAIEVRYTSTENAAYIYCKGTVPMQPDVPYSFIMKCTKNEIGTLDSELYMIMTVSDNDFVTYSKFTCTNAKKTKLDFGEQYGGTGLESVWSNIEITSSAISGYKYTKLGESASTDAQKGFEYKVALYSDVASGLCATTRTRYSGEDGLGYGINYKDGQVIRATGVSSTDDSTLPDSWGYYLKWLTIPSGWVIKKNNGSYTLALEKDGNTPYSLQRREGYTRNAQGEIDTSEPNAVSFEITDDGSKPVSDGTFPCKYNLSFLDSLNTKANELYDSYPHNESDRTKPDTTTLKTLLAAWQ